MSEKVEDKRNQGLEWLSLFIPPIGLILYLTYQKDYPIKAAGIGKWSLIGLAIDVAVFLFL